MRISKLTNLLLDVNATIRSGKCTVSQDEVWQRIAEGTIFEFIHEHLEYSGAMGVLEPVDRLELNLEWDDFRRRWESLPMIGQNSGLWVLVECLVEGIARRAESRDYRLTLETCGRVVPEDEGNLVQDD